MDEKRLSWYPPAEERFNILSHGFGLALGLIGLVLLIVRGLESQDGLRLFSFVVYGCSIVLLYAASTFYHRAKHPGLRYRLNILDHAAIYLLIAGTYTPFTLVTLRGPTGWWIFGIVWGCALVGICLKLFFTGRFNLLSTIMYVAMGWLIIFAFNPMVERLPIAGLYWVATGGIAYTLGAGVFLLEKVKFHHAAFHVFVLVGSFCHYWAVYFYV